MDMHNSAKELDKALGSELQDHFGWPLQWPAAIYLSHGIPDGTISVEDSGDLGCLDWMKALAINAFDPIGSLPMKISWNAVQKVAYS